MVSWWALTTFLAIVFILVAAARHSSGMAWVQATTNGKEYWVKDAAGKDDVANRLAFLQSLLVNVADGIQRMYPADARLRALRSRWNGTLAEVERPGDIAYSLNKRSIHVCVRSPQGTLEPVNSTIYVLLHEVAHVVTEEYGHTPQFWHNFKWLLEVSERVGVYQYQDFEVAGKGSVTHCGHPLGNNVMACVRSKKCASALG